MEEIFSIIIIYPFEAKKYSARRRESTPKPSYWGERESKQWRRKLREKKEKVERELRERLEWRMWEMQRTGGWEDPGKWFIPPKTSPRGKTEMRT